MSNREKYIDRIRKVLALANGTTSKGECHNALKLARKIMIEHSIAMDEVEQVEPDDMGFIEVSVSNRLWKRFLGGVLTEFLGLYGVYDRDNGILKVFGDNMMLTPFEWCWDLAVSEIDRVVVAVSRKHKDRYRKSMVLGIQSVLLEVSEVEPIGTTAIVLRSKEKARGYALSQVTVSDRKPRGVKIYTSVQGYEKGKSVGSRLKNKDRTIEQK